MIEKSTHDAFQQLSDILDTLRKECPWDKKQTLESLRYLTIEETYELSEAILHCTAPQSDQQDNEELKKELGDLFMHLMFYSKIAEDEGRFSLEEVLTTICDKLVARHPFIYQKDNYNGESWEQLKMREGRKSVLEGVPASLPPLVKAVRMLEKASGIGYKEPEKDCRVHDDMDEEAFGDMLFNLVHWAHERGINADDALARANLRFQARVKAFEAENAK